TKRLRERPADSWMLAAVKETGGYEALRKALAMDPAAIAEEVKASGLRGRGGAGFPTATKWSFLPAGVEPRYLVVTSDEAEPSTFKDRMLVAGNPHLLPVGQREPARQLRAGARPHLPPAHRRLRWRPQGARSGQVLHSRRRVVPVADRRAPRRSPRHGPRHPAVRRHARLGGG